MTYFPRKYDVSLQKALSKAFLDVVPEEKVEIVDVLIDRSGRAARVWLKADEDKIVRLGKTIPRVQATIERYWQKRYVPRIELLADGDYLVKIDKLFEKIDEK